ncbi:TetR/AcrR family transcriptional regulator [Salisediminibacterium halotolerans]|uniref:DNA-binding transcriptional regulator, AcrR family n=1 Tax=Salisediminibacterium halotolerans TaxID=517425 RepID=A0A1H9R519_9BACI|nr:TetR/AcrR family transcriptional regulator [Salisediminibacterium haloalkalitolerans]SER67834.1 DNA-binding transcriptional regulator, AcrR family [Salisediminibacterium haloalkalitolerans]
MKKNSRRVIILNAASKIVSERGIFNLTLESVAKEAEISKGGLLYHFPSKEALVQGMVEYLSNNYQEKINQNAEADPLERGKWTRAFLNVTFNQGYPNKDWNSGLLAAKAVKPELLQPLHSAYQDWQEKIEGDGLDPVDATIIRLATDGIWLAELFDFYQIEDEKKRAVYKRLHEWIQDMYYKAEEKHKYTLE